MKTLDEYERKRDFARTPEPSGRDGTGARQGGAADLPEGAAGRFVVQEHHARTLHWDFRLEQDGVLKSWAVPKGVPVEKGTKRLAVQTEDHPLEYLDFEGIIPEGQYGAGTVEIWDKGFYALVEQTENKYYVVLMGKRLRGAYMLVRTKQNQWLIWKRLDENEQAATADGFKPKVHA